MLILRFIVLFLLPVSVLSMPLERAINIALLKNPEFLSYKKRVRVSLRRAKEYLSPFMPRLDVKGDFTRNYGRSTGRYDRTKVYLSLYYNIFNGGSDLYGYLSEKAKVFEDTQAFVEKGLEIIYLVKKNYFEALKMRSLVEAREKILESARYHLELARLRYRLGLTNRSDLMKAEVDLNDAKVELLKARVGLKKSLNSLSRILGLSQKIEVEEIQGNFTIPSGKEMLRRALDRPLVKTKRYALERYRYLLKKARGEFLPSIDLYGNLGYGSRGYTLPDKKEYYIGLEVNIPIFSGFSSYNKFMRYKNEVKRALLELEEIKNRTREELKNSILDYQLSIDVYKSTSVRLKKAEEDLRISEGRYKRGLATFVELKDAQSNYKDALVKNITAYYNIFEKKAYLERIYGEYQDLVLSFLDN